jgi:protein-disulfide isomerase
VAKKKSHKKQVHKKKTHHSTSEPSKSDASAEEHATTTTSSVVWYVRPAFWYIICILVIIVAVALAINKPQTTIAGDGDGVVTVVEYTDFGCPFCAKAAGTLETLKEQNGENIAVEFNHFPIEQLHPNSQKAHEASECARDQGAFDAYHDWLFTNQGSHGVASLKAAATGLGLDTATFNACLDSGEKEAIVKADFNEGLSRGVSATPTFFINDQKLEGAQPITRFESMINAALAAEGEGMAKESGSTSSLTITILNDERCDDCNVAPLIPKLKELFGADTVVNEIDYSTQEGQAIYDASALNALPALLFEEEVVTLPVYAELEPYFRPQGEYLMLAIGATHDPTKEICSNGIDDTANSLVDCDDPDCEGSLECREEIKGDLQLFIMSDCPYGRKAIEALYELNQKMGEDIDYDVHYIASEIPSGFNSLHGQYEVEEDIRQLCVDEHNSKEVHLEYLYCRSVNGVNGVDWNACAQSSGVDIDAVEVCVDGEEGAQLLREDIKVANSLGVSASPTWLAHNRYLFGGIDAVTVQQEICQDADLESCDAVVESNSASAPVGACTT